MATASEWRPDRRERSPTFHLQLAPVLFSILACASRATGTDGCHTWIERAGAGPTVRGEHAMVYDVARSQCVLFGGAHHLCFCQVNGETWTWDGANWNLLAITGPSIRCDNAMTYDAARNVSVSFGGYTQNVHNDTWLFDGAAWTPAAGGPPGRADAGIAFDAARGLTVMLGGLGTAGVLNDMWSWDGSAWTTIAAALPPRRWIHRMAYDAARQRVVTFGGRALGGVLGDTWEWDGSLWQQRTPPVAPSARYGYGLAYDTHRNVTVLFGGQTSFNFGVGVLGDTWEWNGSEWRQRDVSGPAPRSFCKMVYDENRRRMVLFGGHDGTQFLNDTWELTGDAPIPGDADADRDVDLEDLTRLLSSYGLLTGGTPELGDFDGDGDVDLSDLANLLAHYGTNCA